MPVPDLWTFSPAPPTPEQMVLYKGIHKLSMDCLELVHWISSTTVSRRCPTLQDIHERTLALAEEIEFATAPWPTSRRRELALEACELVEMACNQALVALGLGGSQKPAAMPEVMTYHARQALDIARDQVWIARWRACQCIALEGTA